MENIQGEELHFETPKQKVCSTSKHQIANSFNAYIRESGLLFDLEKPWTTVEEQEFEKAGSNSSLHNQVERICAFSGIT